MKVYNDLGQLVLDNAWAGYNTSLFAYGQTGSGKSWSIVGYSPNRGKKIFAVCVCVCYVIFLKCLWVRVNTYCYYIVDTKILKVHSKIFL